MIATRSQTSSTSDSRCEFSSTATPRARSSSSSARTVRRPAGSSALVGSSSSSSFGEPISAWARPRRCCIPFDIVPMRRPPASLQADELEQLRALARPAVGLRELLVQLEQLLARAPVGEAEQLGEVAERPVRGDRPGGGAAHGRAARGRRDEAAGDLDQRALARAVRAQQPDQLALADLEVDAREGAHGAVRLLEAGDRQRRRHARNHSSSSSFTRSGASSCIQWLAPSIRS